MTSRISIAMGTYNGARFIREQLNSLQAQTYAPLELVICDDQSSDDTAAIVRDFASTAPFPVRFQVNEARLGFADNFLKASLLCEGELIAFCDQDDVWYPDKLESCGAMFQSEHTLLCSHDADLCDETGAIVGEHVTGVTSGHHAALALKPWDIYFGFTCVFRRELLQLVDPATRPEDDRNGRDKMSHDSWVYFIGNSLGDTAYVARRLVKYRQHASNLYGSKDLTRLQKVKKLINEYDRYLLKYRGLARKRAQVLIKANPPPDFASRLETAKSFWTNLEALYDRRLQVSAASRLGARSLTVLRLWKAGVYQPLSAGGLGRRAVVEDIVAALSRSLPVGADKGTGPAT